MQDDPLRDVTVLVMLRMMPENDFVRLCESILHAKNYSQALGDNSETSRDIMRRVEIVCDICGAPLRQSKITLTSGRTLGVNACKRCTEGLVGALFTVAMTPSGAAVQLSGDRR
jgi:hypothetical protein